MAEPQTMRAAPEPLKTKADVLKAVDWLKRSDMSPFRQSRYDAIAAAVRGWCVVEGGHRYQLAGEHWCLNCGQRRADGTEGGQ